MTIKVMKYPLMLDASASMREDNKFQITKKILENFIKQRATDRLALSVFADFAYVAVPLTYDKSSLLSLLKYIKIGVAGSRETSLNEALYLSSDLFKNTTSRNKIAILLTDGLDTTSAIPLDVAINKAKKYGIKVYTIGIGKEGDFNSKVLKRIAKETNGKFYETNDLEKLQKIYNQINSLEKSNIKTQTYTSIQYFYQYPLFIAILLTLLLLINLKNKQTKNLKNFFSKDMYAKIILNKHTKKLSLLFLILSFILMLIAFYRPSIQGDSKNISQDSFSFYGGFRYI